MNHRAAKYTSVEIGLLGKEGKAYENADGHFSFPIADNQDLQNAIRAVGRSRTSHDAIRKYIIGRARALGAENVIPANWNSDGSLRRAKAPPESRQTRTPGMELRAATDGTLTFEGYATIFDFDYKVGTFREVFRPGSFRRTLADGPDVTLLINHEGLPLARTSSGTMSLAEDHQGLRVHASLDPENPRARELRSLIQRGDIREMSVAFSIMGQDGQNWSSDYEYREITAANINRGDVSVVTQGANTATSLSMRGLTIEQRKRTARELGTKITGARAIPGGIRAETPTDWQYGDELEACPGCEGTGQIVCPDCRGSGVIDDGYLTGAVGSDGLEEAPIVSSAPDGQRGVVLADLDSYRAEVQALRDGERRKKWEREVNEANHSLQVGRLQSQIDFHDRMRREHMRTGW